MSHMGQSMSRGWGQDTQKSTSGTQGHVYAVVPQTKLANQPDIQCTFMLSQEFYLN